MKELFKVNYVINDKGCLYAPQSKEIPVKKGEKVKDILSIELNKYRKAMNLSKDFTFEIVSFKFIGYLK